MMAKNPFNNLFLDCITEYYSMNGMTYKGIIDVLPKSMKKSTNFSELSCFST